MKKIISCCTCFLILFSLILFSCNKIKPVAEETKDLVFIVNLVNNEKKVEEYMAYHKKVWPEVEASFRKAGYRKINIYRFNKSLVMTVTIPKNADINTLGQVAEAYDKKCREWNQIMEGYQVGVPGTSEGQKWVEAERIYSFKN